MRNLKISREEQQKNASNLQNCWGRYFNNTLPILDDFERAIKAKTDAGEELKEEEGVLLIYNKMMSSLEQKGLKAIEDAIGQELNTDFHEAITNIPAPTEDLKGKIIDVIEKGYFLNDKVIRYAKVVVANNE